MYEYDGILKDREGITCKPVKGSSHHYLYSYRSASKAAKEKKDYLCREKKNGTYDDRIQLDNSVLGSEFINFLSSPITLKILKELDKTKWLEKDTYKKIISVLKRAKISEPRNRAGYCSLRIHLNLKCCLKVMEYFQKILKDQRKS